MKKKINYWIYATIALGLILFFSMISNPFAVGAFKYYDNNDEGLKECYRDLIDTSPTQTGNYASRCVKNYWTGSKGEVVMERYVDINNWGGAKVQLESWAEAINATGYCPETSEAYKYGLCKAPIIENNVEIITETVIQKELVEVPTCYGFFDYFGECVFK